MKKNSFISAMLLAVSLVGCAVGPDYKRPAALPSQPLPNKFGDDVSTNTNQGIWKIAEPSAQLPRGEWWQSFNDSELNRLENLALTNNQNLAATVARFEQSRALATGARANFYPQLTLGGTPNGDITRQQTSQTQPNQGQANDLQMMALKAQQAQASQMQPVSPQMPIDPSQGGMPDTQGMP